MTLGFVCPECGGEYIAGYCIDCDYVEQSIGSPEDLMDELKALLEKHTEITGTCINSIQVYWERIVGGRPRVLHVKLNTSRDY